MGIHLTPTEGRHMNHRRLCLIVGLTALMFVALGQLSPRQSLRSPQRTQAWTQPRTPDGRPTFRVSGSTTSQRHSNGRRHSPARDPDRQRTRGMKKRLVSCSTGMEMPRLAIRLQCRVANITGLDRVHEHRRRDRRLQLSLDGRQRLGVSDVLDYDPADGRLPPMTPRG
jgi:hypothetical protein